MKKINGEKLMECRIYGMREIFRQGGRKADAIGILKDIVRGYKKCINKS